MPYKYIEDIRTSTKKYRETHRDELATKNREYYKNHKDKSLAQKREYDKLHRNERSIYNKKYRNDHREKLVAHQKEYRKAHREEILMKKYRLTIENYDKMLVAQNGVCAICGHPPNWRCLSVDHNHITGNVRGLLCTNCNMMLGLVDDSIEILRSAIEYLNHDVAHVRPL